MQPSADVRETCASEALPRLAGLRRAGAACACLLAAGCASTPPPPAALDLAQARIVVTPTASRVVVDGFSGGRAAGAGIGAGAGSGYGAAAGAAACLTTGPFFPLCLAVVLPTTTAIGAASGAAAGAARSEGVEAMAQKTKLLDDELGARPQNDRLAAQLQVQLAGTRIALASEADANLDAAIRPWTVEVGVREFATDGKAEYALRLVATLAVRRTASGPVWQAEKEVVSENRLTTEQWTAEDRAALRRVVDRCLLKAAQQLATELARPAAGSPETRRPSRPSTASCGDVAEQAVVAATKASDGGR